MASLRCSRDRIESASFKAFFTQDFVRCAGCSGVWSAAADQVRFFPDILPLNGNFLDPYLPFEAQNPAPRPDLNVVKLPPKLCGKKGTDSGKGPKLRYAPRTLRGA